MNISDFLKLILQYLTPKILLTRICGRIAEYRHIRVKNFLIRRFIRVFHVDMTSAQEERSEQYACFNDFFIRRLKPQCRPLADAQIISPVDAVISEMGDIHAGRIIQAKQHQYRVTDLLASSDAHVQPFLNGRFMTLYLSPKDYHRVHMPMTGQLREMVYVPGRLFSVQPATVRVLPGIFSKNERVVAFFDTDVGAMAMVLVGATIVGHIATSWHGGVIRSKTPMRTAYPEKSIILNQGDEMGYFQLGSTVILLFSEQFNFSWQEMLCAGKAVQYGEALSS